MKQRFTGLLILVLVFALAGGYTIYRQKAPKEVSVTGYLGGEKINLFEDPEFVKLMKENYHITMDYRKLGSLDMISADRTGKNYLFPSSATALELYNKLNGKPPQAESIFSTPIVLYSYKPIADALVKAGIATYPNGVYYVDIRKLVEAMDKGTKWEDIGLPDLYGELGVHTTDPTKSNSGNMFAGLVANMLNGGQVVNMGTVDAVNPKLKALIQKVGYMEDSSSTLFENFLKGGMGSKPIIAGYENQILEFAVNNPETWAKLNGNIVIMYPIPTVLSDHIYIALDEQGRTVIPALKDKEIQALAWKKHGFRTGVAGIDDVTIFGVNGVAPSVTKYISMPEVNTMQKILDFIKQ